MKDRILNYLAGGLRPADVASVVGCTPAYISQLLSQDDFKAALNEKISAQPEEAGELRLDMRYESIEHKLLSAMENALASAELPAITQALRIVAERQEKVKQRKNPFPVAPAMQFNVVSLTLPARAERMNTSVQMNEQQEVISIGGAPLAPMSVEGVKNLFNTLRTAHDKEEVNVARTIEVETTRIAETASDF